MAKDIGPRIGIEGESKYKKEMSQIIQQAKTLDAQMKALSASFDDESNAVDKNAKTTKMLQAQIENQKTAVAKLTEMHQKYVDAYGEGDTKTLKFAESLAKAQTKLYGMETDLKKANQELEGFSSGSDEAETNVRELGDEEDRTSKKTSTFGETLKAALSKEAIVGALNAIKDGMVQVGKAAIDFGKQVVMSYADFEQLEGGVKKLFGDDATTVINNAMNAFKTAGMSANEYMETVTSFSASLISSLGDDTEQAARMADIAIRDMSDNANTFGTDIQSLQNAYQGFAKGQFNMLDNLKLGYGGTKSEMERLIKDAESMNSTFKAQRYSNGELALSFADIVAAIDIVQDRMEITGTTANEASGTISGSIDTMKAAFQNFVTGLGMNNADIDLLLGNLVEAFQNVVNNIQPIIERLIDYVPGIVAAVIPVLQGMAPDLVKTAVELFTAFINAIVEVLPDLVPVAIDAINLLSNTLIQHLPTIIEAGVQLIVGLINGFAQALPTLIEQGPMLIKTLANAIIRNLPAILDAGGRIIKTLAEGLLSMASQLPDIILDILFTIKDTFGEGAKAALTWGKDMMINFGNGIAEAASHVWDNVKGVAKGIKKILGFSEPDEGPLSNFHTYAPDMMRLFAQGIKQNQHLVTDAASQAMQGVSNAMQVGAGESNSYNYGGFNIAVYQQPGESSDQLVERLMYQMQNRIDSRKAVFA